MREMNTIAAALFEKIRDRFSDVSLGDKDAKATQDPADARFFNFNYNAESKDLGNITISLIDGESLKIYFSKNISDDLSDSERKQWYTFLRDIRNFARRNLMSFEPRDITRSTLQHRDLKTASEADSTSGIDDVSLGESMNEGKMYGSRKSSYENDGNTRIIVRHTEAVDPEKRGARSRKIKGIFIENAEGERIKLPINNMRYARAMARHVNEGGVVHDNFGQYITSLAEECGKLQPFRSRIRRRTFEDEETQAMATAAINYFETNAKTLKRLSGKRGYNSVKENYVEADQLLTDDFNLDEMKERFAKKTYDDKFNDALPLVQKAYKMTKNTYSEDFKKWADTIAEGTWAQAESDEDITELAELLSQELIVGVDAINATSALYNLIGDDDLFDLLGSIASDDPESDVADTVISWIKENKPELYSKLADQITTSEPDEPAELSEASAPSRYYTDNTLNGYSKWYEELVPSSGKASTVEGELLRSISRIGYDFHNNGFGNNWSGQLAYLNNHIDISNEFAVLHPMSTGNNSYLHSEESEIVAAIDSIADKVLAVINKANGNFTKNSEDSFSYAEEDYEYDDDDDDDDDDEYMEESLTEDVSYGVFSKGGSIGSKNDKPIATFASKEEATEKAKRMRKSLTPGERKYYKMGYTVRPIKEDNLDEGAAEKLRALALAGMIAGGANTVLNMQTDTTPVVQAMTSALQTAKLAGDSAMYNQIRQDIKKVKLSISNGRSGDLNFVQQMNNKYHVDLKESKECQTCKDCGKDDNSPDATECSDCGCTQLSKTADPLSEMLKIAGLK